MSDFEQSTKSLIAHYAAMAQHPATVEQARHSVKRLATEYPETFAELPRQVANEIEKNKEAA